MLKAEWTFLRQHKMMLLVLLMIALIPAIYCYVYLSSMWNTYDHSANIPVAVVNHDRPITYHGHKLAIGHDLTHSLVDSKSLDFHQLTASTARRRLKAGQLYLVVTIPHTFSHNATTLLGTQPQQLHLNFQLNSGANFIVSKMTTGAASAITEKVSRNITQLMTQNLLQALNRATNGMTHAAIGSQRLAQGTQQLQLGIAHQQFRQGQTPTTSTLAVNQGFFRLQTGNQALSTALQTGSQRLATIETRFANAQALAQPVVAQTHDIANVPNNGTGMAPFAIAISLYVGGIALGTMYDGRRLSYHPKNGLSWWASKAVVVGSVGLVQSVLLYVTLRQANALTVRSRFLLFSAILAGSLLFLSLIFCLRLLLGGFGTWLISIVLILQLVSSGGLYPLPLVSPLARALNPWLPMTYLIQVLRSAISTNLALPSAWWLIGLMLVGLNALIIGRFQLDLKKNALALK